MAHTEHAKKTHRQSQKARERNRNARSAMKTSMKSALAAAADPKAAATALAAASARLDKAAKHGTIHPNKAARTKSRLAKAMRKAAAQPPAATK
jgi:small subunit ribosomal protein S20